jgi:hypothetical protein
MVLNLAPCSALLLQAVWNSDARLGSALATTASDRFCTEFTQSFAQIAQLQSCLRITDQALNEAQQIEHRGLSQRLLTVRCLDAFLDDADQKERSHELNPPVVRNGLQGLLKAATERRGRRTRWTHRGSPGYRCGGNSIPSPATHRILNWHHFLFWVRRRPLVARVVQTVFRRRLACRALSGNVGLAAFATGMKG